MHADISRDTFDPRSNTLRVVQEQGAVLLDADANEQTAILLHRLHGLAADLFGPFWGPAGGSGFHIDWVDTTHTDLTISPGRYYVNGLLCENAPETPVTFLTQPAYPNAALPDKPFDPAKPFAVYLEAWEREVPEAETRNIPGRIDPAFQALSPAPRAQLVWQVKVFQAATPDATALQPLYGADPWKAATALSGLLFPPPPAPPALQAQVVSAQTSSYNGDYSGPENQLYRVEIHRRGLPYPAGSGALPTSPKCATFKWSRDNGSVAFPLDLSAVDMSSGNPVWQPDANNQFLVTLTNTGRDDRTILKIHDRVEYIDRAIVLTPNAFEDQPIRQLFEVVVVDSNSVTLRAPRAGAINLPVLPEKLTRWAFLRRWDFQLFGNAPPLTTATGAPPQGDDGALVVVTPSAADTGSPSQEWLDMEDQIQIRFPAAGPYHPGDFWLIPARTASGDVVWPQTAAKDKKGNPIRVPKTVPARPTRRYFAPLAVFNSSATNPLIDCRRQATLGALISPLA
ncbi:MAG TPA: DUF6519 domain-containing protein [Urbifossiella sp.]|jgi:hypothetical protein|nr:DUF6519 domain-containing protein [Urbifossiella sp.]